MAILPLGVHFLSLEHETSTDVLANFSREIANLSQELANFKRELAKFERRLPFWREFWWVLPVRVASGVDTEFPYQVRIVDRGVDCRHHFRFPDGRWGEKNTFP